MPLLALVLPVCRYGWRAFCRLALRGASPWVLPGP